MIAAAAAEPRAKRSPKPFADNSESLKAVEAAALVLTCGWSFDAAIALTCADPVRAQRRIKAGGRLPYVPTPQMVADEARRLRRFPIGRGED